MTQAQETSVASTREAPSTMADLAIAFGLVGAGLGSVSVFIGGLMALNESPEASLWAVGGLLAYLAVWGLGLVFASRS